MDRLPQQDGLGLPTAAHSSAHACRHRVLVHCATGRSPAEDREKRADERELAEQRAQDEALQACLNQMSELILDRNLLEVEQGVPVHEQGDPVHTLAQARTSTAILRLNAEHNESVTRFLIDSGLAVKSQTTPSLLRDISLSMRHSVVPTSSRPRS